MHKNTCFCPVGWPSKEASFLVSRLLICQNPGPLRHKLPLKPAEERVFVWGRGMPNEWNLACCGGWGSNDVAELWIRQSRACSLRVLDRRASYRVSPLGSEQQDQISQLAVDIAKDLARDVYLQGETGTSSTMAVYTDLPTCSWSTEILFVVESLYVN